MILNRFDQVVMPGVAFGAGYQLLSTASYDADEVSLMLHILDTARQESGARKENHRQSGLKDHQNLLR